MKPYLLRALYEWCADAGLTPYLTVAVGPGVVVPMEYVREDQIVLNISMQATQSLTLENDSVQFRARFGGIVRDIYVPVGAVKALYARETGQGMGFIVEEVTDTAEEESTEHDHKKASLSLVSTSEPDEKHAKTKDVDDSEIKKADDSTIEPEDDDPPPPPVIRPKLTRIK